jgi:hypothetical protein
MSVGKVHEVWKAREAKDRTPKNIGHVLAWVPATALHASPMLDIAWRLNIDITANVLIPKKVLVFLREDLSLQAGHCQRIA